MTTRKASREDPSRICYWSLDTFPAPLASRPTLTVSGNYTVLDCGSTRGN